MQQAGRVPSAVPTGTTCRSPCPTSGAADSTLAHRAQFGAAPRCVWVGGLEAGLSRALRCVKRHPAGARRQHATELKDGRVFDLKPAGISCQVADNAEARQSSTDDRLRSWSSWIEARASSGDPDKERAASLAYGDVAARRQSCRRMSTPAGPGQGVPSLSRVHFNGLQRAPRLGMVLASTAIDQLIEFLRLEISSG